MPSASEPIAVPPAAVVDAFRTACRFDVLADKPGNVSVRTAGHRMQAGDFLRSAEVTSRPLTVIEAGVGHAIYSAVVATQRAVGCNTNLGILLLCAPLAHAALQSGSSPELVFRTRALLAGTTCADAAWTFAAIRLANPAGLGRVEAQDVSSSPTLSLTAAMTLAAERDSIAAEYANGFDAVFNEGLPLLRRQCAARGRLSAATTACYLHFLSTRPDSHIARKHGNDLATQIQSRAAIVTSALKACENPRRRLSILVAFDKELKNAGVNPGTSADLTVASILAWLLDTSLKEISCGLSLPALGG